jgi:hypothetical protein
MSSPLGQGNGAPFADPRSAQAYALGSAY